MDVTPDSTITTLALPLELYESVKIAEATGKNGESFEIYAGLTEEMIAQLRQKSLDESDEVLQVTSDKQRFGEGNYVDWYAKGRVPFALIQSTTGRLAAIAWFGPKPLGRKAMKNLSELERTEDESKLDAGNWHTIAYRAYIPYRGKGLMKNFVEFAINVYSQQYPGARFWEISDINNEASMALAAKLGFVKDTEASGIDGKWLIMVRDATR